MKELPGILLLCGMLGCSNTGLGLEDERQTGEKTTEQFSGKETLLPIVEGNWWKMSGTMGEETWSVAGDTVVSGYRYMKMYYSFDGHYDLFALYRIGEDGSVYRRGLNEQEVRYNPAASADPYFSGGEMISAGTVDTVVTPSGVFTQCLVFRGSPAPRITATGDTLYVIDGGYSTTLKPGIGFVAQNNDWSAGGALVEYSVVMDHTFPEEEENRCEVRFDFQYGFNHTPARIEIDGSTAYRGVITTNHVLSLADSRTVELCGGTHVLHCETGTDFRDTTFTVTGPLVIGIVRDAETGTGFRFYHPGEFPAYD